VVTEISLVGIQAGTISKDSEGNELITGAGSVSGRKIEVMGHWDEERTVTAMARHYLQDIPDASEEDIDIFEGIARRCAERSREVGSFLYKLP